MSSTPTSGSDGTPSLAQREQIDRIADQFEREFDAGTNPAIEAWIERHRELHKRGILIVAIHAVRRQLEVHFSDN
jgi:coproporphyrinogen III oxidase-like Fe-S oxidoreductase